MRHGQIQNTLNGLQKLNTSTTGLKNLGNMASNISAAHSTGNMITDQANQTLATHATSGPNYKGVVQQRLMGDIRKCLEESIPVTGFQYKPYVFSEFDFQMKMTAYVALNNRETPVDTLDDFPTDPETQRRLVREIVEAMMNMDKSTLIDPEARLPLARIKKLSPFELDLMAWNVLIETRNVHRGAISLPTWGKDWPFEDFKSFSDRFKAVRKALYHCKAMVSSLFDEVFAKRLPLNPTVEFSRKSSNRRLNGKRKQDLELAKGAKKDGFVPSNSHQTLDESVTSTSRWPSGPDSTPLLSRRVSSTQHEHKRRRINDQAVEVDHDFFNLDQNTASFANCFEQLLIDQDSVMGSFHFPAPNEIGSGMNESAFNRIAIPDTGSMLASPLGIHTKRERTGELSNSNATQQFLPASSVYQWFDNTAAVSDQATQQGNGRNLDAGLLENTLANPTSSDQGTDQASYFSEVDDGNVGFFQGRQETSDYTTTYSQQEAISATLTTQKLYQTQLPQYLSNQDEAMYGDSLLTTNVNYSANNEEVEKLLDMPGLFDPELGVWKGKNGETMNFSF